MQDAPDTAAAQNAQDLEHELDWFARLLDARFKRYFEPAAETPEVLSIAPPALDAGASHYARFLRQHGLQGVERLALVLCLVPHLRPQLLDVFHTRNATFDRRFTEFGGVRDGNGDFQPTGDTLAFIVGGAALAPRLALAELFEREHVFARHDILRPELQGPGEATTPVPMKAPLRLSPQALALITRGQSRPPELGKDFPARQLETGLAWSDLVLHPGTLEQVEEIATWLRHGATLMGDWGMAAKLRPGYRALFYGPPGTGKTMTACLLGRATAREVYKVDLSLVVSKYIGETEKNLSRVFEQAQHKGWILFFDEADALFGKRSETRDAHDRYANQEVSYLLQRIEVFDGIAILASNLKANIDAAFARRFESVIYFPPPGPAERLRLWRQGFSSKAQLDGAVDLERIARDHELCGGAIMNVVRYASLQALDQDKGRVTPQALQRGIARELRKEGRAP